MLDKISLGVLKIFVSWCIFCFLALTSHLAFGAVVVEGTQPLDKDRNWVFMTVTVDGVEYKYTHVAPASLSGAELQAYVGSREDFYTHQILLDLYPGRPMNLHTLPQVRDWIADGHKVKVKDKEDKLIDKVIEKKAKKYGHPPKIKLQKDLEDASTDAEKLQILMDYVAK